MARQRPTALLRTLGFLFTLTFLATAQAVTAPLADDRGEFIPGQVVLRLKSGPGQTPTRANADALAARFGQASVRPLLPEKLVARGKHRGLEAIYILDYGQGADVRSIAAQIATDSNVAYAEPNYICRTMTTPNDPYYATTGSWGQSYADMWGLYRIGLNPVGTGSGWDYETGQSNPVVVAVIDTGIDAAHEDITGHLWTNPNEIPGNGLDDDNNGYIDDVRGWDFVSNDNDPQDGHGHGTHCSGTIAAMTDNGLGVAGISWGATIMPVKGLSDGGSGGSTGLANAVIYAADNGASILSNSWGGISVTSPQVLHDAFTYAAGKGCLSVAAAGNEGNDLFAPYPAKYSEVLAVAATDPDDLKASFSNFGSVVDLSAPGVDILSLRSAGTDMYGDGTHIVGSNYYRASGTSMACPHVAGVAALLWSAYPGWTAEQVRDHLKRATDSIDQISQLYPGALGTGRLNARRSLSVTTPQPLLRVEQVVVDDSTAANPNLNPDPGETVNLVMTVGNTWLSASSVTTSLSSADPQLSILKASASFGPVAEWDTAANSGDPFTISVSPGCPFGHIATLMLDINADGYLGQESFTLAVASPALAARGYLVLDTDGDRDRALDPGETTGLVIRLGNAPYGAAVGNVTAILSSTDSYVSVGKNTAAYPDVTADQVISNDADPFRITLDPGFPADHVATLQLAVSADGWSQILDVELTLPAIHREISNYVAIPDPFGGSIDPYSLNAAIDTQDRIHVAWDHPDVDIGYMIAHREWDTWQWLPRRYVAGNGRTSVGGTHLGLDSAGWPHLSWNEITVIDAGGFPLVARGIYYRNRPGQWSPVYNVSNRPDSLENNMANAIAVDRDDNVHIAWLFTHYSEGGAFIDQTLYHSRRINGTWQPEEVIAVNAVAEVYYEMTLLPTSDGRLWLLYRKHDPSFPILYRTWNGTSWSAQAQVPTGGQLASVFSAAIDAQDRIHVFFRNYESPARLFYLKYAGGGWSSPVQAPAVAGSLNLSYPRVHVDREDNLHLLWVVRTKPASYYVDQIYTWRQADGAWIGPEALTNFPYTPGKYLTDLAMVVDSAGRRHVFYIEYMKGLYHFLASSIASPPPVQLDADTLIFQDGRQYPGGIAYAGTLDAHLLESSPLNNTGSHIALEATRTDGLDPAGDRTIVIRFDNQDTSTQAGRFLQQATLTLNYFGSRNDPGGVHKTLSVHRLLQDWGEGVQTGIDGAFANDGEACWDKPFGSSVNNNPPWAGTLTYGMADPVPLDSVTLGGPEDYGPVRFDVTSAVRRQFLGQVPDFGLVIRETAGSESTEDGTRQFDASEAVNILDRPSLTLIFAAPARGDFDRDGDVDLDDFAHLQACLTGRNVAQQNDACQNARLDADTDVDADDVTLLRACLRGAGVPADPGCNP